MHIPLTASAGYIGSPIQTELVTHGHEVTAAANLVKVADASEVPAAPGPKIWCCQDRAKFGRQLKVRFELGRRPSRATIASMQVSCPHQRLVIPRRPRGFSGLATSWAGRPTSVEPDRLARLGRRQSARRDDVVHDQDVFRTTRAP
jgi:hypothetical protein